MLTFLKWILYLSKKYKNATITKNTTTINIFNNAIEILLK